MGFEPVTSAIRLRCSTNWAMKPYIGSGAGIAEVTGSNPVEALIFFRLPLSSCLNWKFYCDDHSSLWSTTAVQIYELFHIYFTSTRFYWLVPKFTVNNYCFVLSHGQKWDQWHSTKNFDHFHNHSPLLTMETFKTFSMEVSDVKTNVATTKLFHSDSFKIKPLEQNILRLTSVVHICSLQSHGALQTMETFPQNKRWDSICRRMNTCDL